MERGYFFYILKSFRPYFHLHFMICYHGSHLQGLKQLTYREENSRFGGDEKLLYGAAIYLTTSPEEAKSYATGGSYYKILISQPVFDSTNEEDLAAFIKEFEASKGIEESILENPEIKTLIRDTIAGKSSGLSFADNLFMVISNEPSLYYIITSYFQEDVDACLDSLTNLFKPSFVKINRKGQTWVLCLDKEGYGMEIVEEIAWEE